MTRNVRVQGHEVQVCIDHTWRTVGYIDNIDGPRSVETLLLFQRRAFDHGRTAGLMASEASS